MDLDCEKNNATLIVMLTKLSNRLSQREFTVLFISIFYLVSESLVTGLSLFWSSVLNASPTNATPYLDDEWS